MAAGVTNTTAGTDWGKADFEAIYNCPDPRRYFTTLQPLEYQIPHHGQAVFRALTENLRRRRGDRPPLSVVDLCCSYGVNAALLNHRLSLTDLYARYAGDRPDGPTTGQLTEEDRTFYATRRRAEAVRMTGIDAAERAVGYARAVGLLDHGFAENLELDEPSPELRAVLAGTDLITVTGGVGYISARTFGRLFDCVSRPPWVAAFVLRTVSYRPVSALLARAGLVTEQLTTRTFRQRQFADADERRAAFEALARRGLSIAGKESDGFYHADFYLSRPAAEVAELPLTELLPG
ncbi:class I SAM-dependent methyltransferase [Streptomyces platensis subsp. malvinus]